MIVESDMQVNRIIQLAGKPPDDGKYRIAAYCRVSTELESQKSSIETQQRAYAEMAAANPAWVLEGVYVDSGLSGTKVEGREAFTRMVRDAEDGKIDYVITKSISRFARNTLECLEYVRRLNGIGVQLYFEKENIDTGAAFSEMLLTILAAFAQEESRSISENVKWGIRKRYGEGTARWTNCYGYRKGEGGEYLVEQDEAAVVQFIFALYEQGRTISQIKDRLNEDGVPTPNGAGSWQSSVIQRMIANEKYAGDILLQKKYTVDHLTHRQVKNDGRVRSYYLKDHHTPIITRRTFDRVAAIREMRSQGGGKGKPGGRPKQYPFGRMLKCPVCGGTLHRETVRIKEHFPGWVCSDFIIRAENIERAAVAAYNALEGYDGLPEGPEKELLLFYKAEMPQMETAEYFWLDDLVDHIEIGRHEGEEDRILTVFWKAGLKTTVSTGITRETELPGYLAELYRERKEGATA